MKVVSGKRMAKLAEENGWSLARMNGSHHVLLRKRFSFVSCAAMIAAAVFGTLIMLRFPGCGLGGTLGIPFPWFWATDVIIMGQPSSGVYWLGLIADIGIWFIAVIAFGIFIEFLTGRFFSSREKGIAGQEAPPP